METVKGVQGKTEYHAVATIDEQTIFADKEGYFLFEHYPSCDGGYYALPVRLGKTAKEVMATLMDLCDWHYRNWHGEGDAIDEFERLVMSLPTIE